MNSPLDASSLFDESNANSNSNANGVQKSRDWGNDMEDV